MSNEEIIEAVQDYFAPDRRQAVTITYLATFLNQLPQDIMAAAETLVNEGVIKRSFIVHCEGRRIRGYDFEGDIPKIVFCDIHDEGHLLHDLTVWRVYSRMTPTLLVQPLEGMADSKTGADAHIGTQILNGDYPDAQTLLMQLANILEVDPKNLLTEVKALDKELHWLRAQMQIMRKRIP